MELKSQKIFHISLTSVLLLPNESFISILELIDTIMSALGRIARSLTDGEYRHKELITVKSQHKGP